MVPVLKRSLQNSRAHSCLLWYDVSRDFTRDYGKFCTEHASAVGPHDFTTDTLRCSAELQHKIVRRMRSLGMTPVFPAFAGFVPEALARERPHAHITRSDNWCAFPERYCCVHLLDPLEPLFQEIGSAFVKVTFGLLLTSRATFLRLHLWDCICVFWICLVAVC